MNKKGVLKEVLSWIGHIAFAVILVVCINTFILQPTQVQGKSMESTLHNKDRVIINRLPHTFNNEYKYGDIVVIDSRVDRDRTLVDEVMVNFKNNLISYYITGKQENCYWIKRVIGKEGDVLEFKDGQVIRNGEVLDEPYTCEKENYYENQVVEVPKGYVFVMGDNRNVSLDSRRIGCVPTDHVLGKYWVSFSK